MFLHALTDPEREAFLALARDYIQADQKISFQEEAMLKQLCLEIGLAPDHYLPAHPRAHWLAQIVRRRARVSALFELLALVNADKHFDARERELVFETAKAWGITEAELEKMANWHDRLAELLAEAFLLMEMPEPPPLPGQPAETKGPPKKTARKDGKKPSGQNAAKRRT